jgi:hypothetical protein
MRSALGYRLASLTQQRFAIAIIALKAPLGE